MSTIAQEEEVCLLIVSSGIVSNLAKKVSSRIRTQVDTDHLCSPSLTTFPEWVWGRQWILRPISLWNFPNFDMEDKFRSQVSQPYRRMGMAQVSKMLQPDSGFKSPWKTPNPKNYQVQKTLSLPYWCFPVQNGLHKGYTSCHQLPRQLCSCRSCRDRGSLAYMERLRATEMLRSVHDFQFRCF